METFVMCTKSEDLEGGFLYNFHTDSNVVNCNGTSDCDQSTCESIVIDSSVFSSDYESDDGGKKLLLLFGEVEKEVLELSYKLSYELHEIVL